MGVRARGARPVYAYVQVSIFSVYRNAVVVVAGMQTLLLLLLLLRTLLRRLRKYQREVSVLRVR